MRNGLLTNDLNFVVDPQMSRQGAEPMGVTKESSAIQASEIILGKL